MSASPESIAVDRPRRMWKIVAAVAAALVALPVSLGIGGWAAGQLATPTTAATPSRTSN
jgi:hypothetical protein